MVGDAGRDQIVERHISDQEQPLSFGGGEASVSVRAETVAQSQDRTPRHLVAPRSWQLLVLSHQPQVHAQN